MLVASVRFAPKSVIRWSSSCNKVGSSGNKRYISSAARLLDQEMQIWPFVGYKASLSRKVVILMARMTTFRGACGDRCRLNRGHDIDLVPEEQQNGFAQSGQSVLPQATY